MFVLSFFHDHQNRHWLIKVLANRTSASVTKGNNIRLRDDRLLSRGERWLFFIYLFSFESTFCFGQVPTRCKEATAQKVSALLHQVLCHGIEWLFSYLMVSQLHRTEEKKKKKKLEHVNYRDHCGELQYHCRRRKGKGNIKHCPEGNSFILQNDWVLFVCFLILWECNYRSHLLLKIYSLLLGQ